ncbi:DUF2255 family protein [Streptomyces sp. NPDC001705]
MTAWTSEELARIGTAEELRITPLRSDGSSRTTVPIWVVRDGDDLYIRSFRGSQGAWYRAARATQHARIAAAGVENDVTLTAVDDADTNDRVDAAYRTKYGRYAGTYLDPMITTQARGTTLRLAAMPEAVR